MTIKQHGGIFGRNPTFNEIGGTLTTAAQPNITSLGTQTSNLAFADGNGIDFSATAGTGTSELFDDYEEGTWTPVASDGSNNASAGTSTGTYTKCGNSVTVHFQLVDINTTGLTSGNNLSITGLPYTNNSSTRAHGSVIAARTTDGLAAVLEIGASDAFIVMRKSSSLSGSGSSVTIVSDLSSGTADLRGSITYHV